MRRLTLLAAAVVWAPLVHAQVNLSQPVSTAGTAIPAQTAPSQPGKSQNPMEPSGFPQLPSKEGELPPPRKYGPEEKVMQIVESGSWSRSGTKITGTGGIHAKYRGYDIFGDTINGDTATNIFTLSGGVRVLGADSVIHGDRVTVNFNDNTFRSETANIDLHPSFFPVGRVLDDIYAKGLDSYGSRREVWGDTRTPTKPPLLPNQIAKTGAKMANT